MQVVYLGGDPGKGSGGVRKTWEVRTDIKTVLMSGSPLRTTGAQSTGAPERLWGTCLRIVFLRREEAGVFIS